MAVLQQAHALANTIDIQNLSAEGAANLLIQPDPNLQVDYNNDGMTEIGEGRLISFPPPNAPEHVKRAWQEATEGLNELDKSRLELRMHTTVYGIQIDAIPSKTPLPASLQWSQGGLQSLVATLYAQLDFSVSMEGWSEHHKAFEQVIQRFETNLDLPEQQAISTNSNTASAEIKNHDVMQLLLDARLGIDREKLEEIEEKIQKIANNPDIPDHEKQQLIQSLQEKKEAILAQARRLIT
ncbi:hypothetical protein [Aliidiomarina taiwanensis]|nr:hypothetical protein [Aliidiomarina taiwanensis]